MLARDPLFALRDPAGRESTYKLYPGTPNSTVSVDVCTTTPKPVHTVNLGVVNGTWVVETRGEYMGSVRIVVVASEPAA